MLDNSRFELIGLLIDEFICISANFQCAPLLIPLDVDLADSKDPFKAALSEVILDHEEASDRFEALLDII